MSEIDAAHGTPAERAAESRSAVEALAAPGAYGEVSGA